MYSYIPFEILDNSLKKYHFNIILSSDRYFFRQEDKVIDKFNEILLSENIKDNKIDGYLILDDLGLKQIEYLLQFLTFDSSDGLAPLIIENLAKQTILL